MYFLQELRKGGFPKLYFLQHLFRGHRCPWTPEVSQIVFSTTLFSRASMPMYAQGFPNCIIYKHFVAGSARHKSVAKNTVWESDAQSWESDSQMVFLPAFRVGRIPKLYSLQAFLRGRIPKSYFLQHFCRGHGCPLYFLQHFCRRASRWAPLAGGAVERCVQVALLVSFASGAIERRLQAVGAACKRRY